MIQEGDPLSSVRKQAWQLTSSQKERERYIAAAKKEGSCTLSPLPKECTVLPLAEAFLKHGPILQKSWAAQFQEIDSPSLLNLALHKEGFWIYVPAKCVVKEPLHVAPATLSRLHLYLGAGAQLNVQIAEEQASLCFEATLEKGAQLTVQGGCDTVRCTLKEGACAQLKSVRYMQDVACILDGEGAEATFAGLSRLGERVCGETRVKMHHRAPRTVSKQTFHAVLERGAKSTFEGVICIDRLAQQSEAVQQSKALILEKGAVAKHTPILNIHADDVKASHGSTVAQLNELEMFYLRSRGITLVKAKQLLVDAFCKEGL